ncbi:hypothetical protein H2199_007401 [Coniosporium tulheliwenetii]|uniref:Uncharacterized protein n=1 Tax=Coniosporium tulheliwenetii TaxID=3383036 RepID=A0ACC2YRG6_9PEZI|nr:hypothetical protein H2199_007401 [Cladosporium sp. JES 115]
MCTDPFRRKARCIAHSLNDSGDIRRAVELTHLLRHADISIHKRFVIRDHIEFLLRRRALERICRPAKEVPPERGRDELKEGKYTSRPQGSSRGATRGRLPGQQQIKQLKAERVALVIEPFLEIRDAGHAFLRVREGCAA